MSKVKVNPAESNTVKSQQLKSPENKKKVKKKKHRVKNKSDVKQPPAKEDVNSTAGQMLPPKDAHQFSTNWKMLQQLLKMNKPPEKKHAETQNSKNAGSQNTQKTDTQKKLSTKTFKNDPNSTQEGTGKVRKEKTVLGKVAQKDFKANAEGPMGSAVQQSKVKQKRKNNGEIVNSDRPAKKTKVATAAKESKPTEADLWFDDVDPDDIEATLGADAADIMRRKQGIQRSSPADTERALVKERAFDGLTKAVAIDCEMVGVGPNGEESIVARVSLVNQFGKCIYDKFVKPTEKVTDYRTEFSGIRPEDIRNGEDVHTVQREVADILRGRMVVGHAIHNDLKILLLDHPKKKIRDTQKYKPFRQMVKSSRPSLKVLCREILHVKVQQGEHSSVQDAQATMRLYTLVKKKWEAEIKSNQKNSSTKMERRPKSPKSKNSRLTGS